MSCDYECCARYFPQKLEEVSRELADTREDVHALEDENDFLADCVRVLFGALCLSDARAAALMMDKMPELELIL